MKKEFLALLILFIAAAGQFANAAEGTIPKAASKRIEAAITRDERPDAGTVMALAEGGAILVDVRSLEEWNAGHAKGALFLPVREVEAQAGKKILNKDSPIVTYCAVGGRALSAAKTLRQLGYTHVTAMIGGFDDLKKAGYPITE
ncbi:MAG: rhodanese-like domain-containing protein [Pseudomonadota bacterium]